jgi:hypothetical protein
MKKLKLREIKKSSEGHKTKRCKSKSQIRFVTINSMVLEIVLIQTKVDILLFSVKSILGNSLLSFARKTPSFLET